MEGPIGASFLSFQSSTQAEGRTLSQAIGSNSETSPHVPTGVLEPFGPSGPTCPDRAGCLACFHAFCFFPLFCPFCWPPLFLHFSPHFFALFSPSKKALFCRASAQSLAPGPRAPECPGHLFDTLGALGPGAPRTLPRAPLKIVGLAKNHPWMLTTLGCPGTPDPRTSSVDKFLRSP